jgi:hypothetical protein
MGDQKKGCTYLHSEDPHERTRAEDITVDKLIPRLLLCVRPLNETHTKSEHTVHIKMADTTTLISSTTSINLRIEKQ